MLFDEYGEARKLPLRSGNPNRAYRAVVDSGVFVWATPRTVGCPRILLLSDPDLVLRHDWGGVRARCDATTTLSPDRATVNPFENPVDFSDPDSQRVLTAAARAVARELGREAARKYFAELLNQGS